MAYLFRSQPLWVLVIILANIVLSWWRIYADPIINNDGITYLGLAQHFLDGQWQQAFAYYNWPFYSLFIALTSFITGLELEHSAHLLNLVFVTSLSLAFVSIVSELSPGNKKLLIIAALVILFFPSIAKYRNFITRDFGYLSFYLWSLYFIFQYLRQPTKRNAFYWLLFSALSCLFRFEGILFIVIVPTLHFLLHPKLTAINKRQLMLLAPFGLAILLGLTLWFLLSKYDALISFNVGESSNMISLLTTILSNIQQRLDGNEFQLLTTVNFIIGNSGFVLYEVLRRLAVVYFLLSLYAVIKRHCFTANNEFKVWIYYLVVNFILLASFSLVANFFVSRYAMAMVLTLLIPAPVTLALLWQHFSSFGAIKKALCVLLALILIAISADRLSVETEKRHLKDAGQWIKQNLPTDVSVYSNERLLLYYAGTNPLQLLHEMHNNLTVHSMLRSFRRNNYDYLVFHARMNSVKDVAATRQHMRMFGKPVHTVSNEHHRVYIYKNVPVPMPRNYQR